VEKDAKIFSPADASPSYGLFLGKGILRMAMPSRESFYRFQWDSDDDPQSGEASAGSPPFLFFHFLFHKSQ